MTNPNPPTGAAGEVELPKSDLWVIPGDDNANSRGFIDARAWQEDEFSQPMFDADQMRAIYLKGREDERAALAKEQNHD